MLRHLNFEQLVIFCLGQMFGFKSLIRFFSSTPDLADSLFSFSSPWFIVVPKEKYNYIIDIFSEPWKTEIFVETIAQICKHSSSSLEKISFFYSFWFDISKNIDTSFSSNNTEGVQLIFSFLILDNLHESRVKLK